MLLFYFILDKVQLKRKRLRTGNDVNLFDISPHDGRKFSIIYLFHFISSLVMGTIRNDSFSLFQSSFLLRSFCYEIYFIKLLPLLLDGIRIEFQMLLQKMLTKVLFKFTLYLSIYH